MVIKIKSLNNFQFNNRIHAAISGVNMEEAAYCLEKQTDHTSLAFSSIPIEGYLFKVANIQSKDEPTWVISDDDCSYFLVVQGADSLDRNSVLNTVQAIFIAEEIAYLKGIEKGKLIHKNELRQLLGFKSIKCENED